MSSSLYLFRAILKFSYAKKSWYGSEELRHFDKAKVKADADAYNLPDDLAAIDMAKVEAEFYDQAIKLNSIFL